MYQSRYRGALIGCASPIFLTSQIILCRSCCSPREPLKILEKSIELLLSRHRGRHQDERFNTCQRVAHGPTSRLRDSPIRPKQHHFENNTPPQQYTPPLPSYYQYHALHTSDSTQRPRSHFHHQPTPDSTSTREPQINTQTRQEGGEIQIGAMVSTFYPRAQVKKTIKAHTNRPLSKNVDILIFLNYTLFLQA